jgi:hypothetical protein
MAKFECVVQYGFFKITDHILKKTLLQAILIHSSGFVMTG